MNFNFLIFIFLSYCIYFSNSFSSLTLSTSSSFSNSINNNHIKVSSSYSKKNYPFGFSSSLHTFSLSSDPNSSSINVPSVNNFLPSVSSLALLAKYGSINEIKNFIDNNLNSIRSNFLLLNYLLKEKRYLNIYQIINEYFINNTNTITINNIHFSILENLIRGLLLENYIEEALNLLDYLVEGSLLSFKSKIKLIFILLDRLELKLKTINSQDSSPTSSSSSSFTTSSTSSSNVIDSTNANLSTLESSINNVNESIEKVLTIFYKKILINIIKNNKLSINNKENIKEDIEYEKYFNKKFSYLINNLLIKKKKKLFLILFYYLKLFQDDEIFSYYSSSSYTSSFISKIINEINDKKNNYNLNNNEKQDIQEYDDLLYGIINP